MEGHRIEATILGIEMPEHEEIPRVILQESPGDRRFAVPVGPFEASAIIIELEGISPPRPLTHDLLADTFREAGFNLEYVELFGSSSEGPGARLAYRRGFKHLAKDVRPSDAIALALRLKAPIFAEEGLFAFPQPADDSLARLEPGRSLSYNNPHGPPGAHQGIPR